MFGYIGEAWRCLLVDFGLCGALAAQSTFVNCDRQLGGLSDGGLRLVEDPDLLMVPQVVERECR
jgi:hypothetical protein